MDTKKFKTASSDKAKAGKNNANFTLAAGAAVAGGVAGALLNGGNDDPIVEPEPIVENLEETQEEQQQETTVSQQHTEENTGDKQEYTDIVEPQPIDNGGTVANQGGTTNPVTENTPENPAADEVAMAQIHSLEEDEMDIDVVNIVTPDAIDTLYLDDGNEQAVALVHGTDNEQYMLIDLDNDQIYDVVTDMMGNPIVAVEGGLSVSDFEESLNGNGGYLAINPNDMKQHGDELNTGDIINTDGNNDGLLAWFTGGDDKTEEQDPPMQNEVQGNSEWENGYEEDPAMGESEAINEDFNLNEP